MSQFKFFHDDWLDVSELLSDHFGTINFPVNLTKDFFVKLSLNEKHLRDYRIEAARNAANRMGTNIAICFSGGVDSQCMLQCFLEAGIKIDVYTLKFKQDLNKQDVDHAIKYCETANVKLNVIELDVLEFLNRHNFDYGMKYKSASPHFNVHYKLFDLLHEEGYDGVISGGNTFLFSTGTMSFLPNINRNTMNYINYSNISNFKCNGNFLSYYPKLAWAISFLSPPLMNYVPHTSFIDEKTRSYWEQSRYIQKIKGYRRAGFKIIPQQKKFTGFELVKKYLQNKTGDGWSFEKLYRHPLERLLIKNKTVLGDFIFLEPDTAKQINLIYSNNLLPGQGSASGI